MNEPRRERRLHTRISPKGTVLIAHEHRGRIANLSEGGVFVVCDAPALGSLRDREVDLELRVDAGQAAWMTTTGRIVRRDPGGLAIAFAAPPAALVRVIDELATASRAHARIISVVLIDADDPRRAAMANGFRAIGCDVIEAATPLEAIVRLGESSFEPDVVAVADSHPPEAAEEMREFVERAHPHARLITIGDEVLRPDGILDWLSSADPDRDLPVRVREALVSPRHTR